MSLFNDFKKLVSKIADKFRDTPDDLRIKSSSRDSKIRQAMVDEGRKSFISKIKDKFIHLFRQEKPTKEIEREVISGVDILPNLDELLVLINKELHDQIKKDMGTGDRKDILNYRTGRFAKSARALAIENDSEGLVARFTFMRHPYGTFLPGGKQQYPRSRRPDHLIRKSIRQIAFSKLNLSIRAILEGGVDRIK